MCILIAKPKGVRMPDLDILKKCWDSNNDGAGIAWSDGRKLIMKKGYMNWESFKDDVANMSIDAYNAIIHFRIATHGTVKPENTHPFSVNESIVAAHNGILSGVKNEGDWTDSETFFKRICAPILASFDMTSDVFKKCVDAMIGSSKLVFLRDKGDMVMFGTFIEDGGVYYSNTTYKEDRFSYVDYHGWGYGRYGYGYQHSLDERKSLPNNASYLPDVKRKVLTEQEQENIIFDMANEHYWWMQMEGEDDISMIRKDFIELMNKYGIAWFKIKECAARHYNVATAFDEDSVQKIKQSPLSEE